MKNPTVEQLESSSSPAADGPKYKKFLKRLTSKVWRRMARQDPEGAPKKRPTKGWSG